MYMDIQVTYPSEDVLKDEMIKDKSLTSQIQRWWIKDSMTGLQYTSRMLSYIRLHRGLISEPYFCEVMHWPVRSRSGEELLQTTKMSLDLLPNVGMQINGLIPSLLWNNSDSDLQEDNYPKLEFKLMHAWLYS